MRKTAWAAVLLAVTAKPAVCASYDDLNAGISFFNQAQYDETIIWFDKAIAAGGLIPDLKHVAHLDRGMAHAAKGDTQKAIADYTAAIAIKPESTLAYRSRAGLYLALNDKEMARADYRQLLKVRPYDSQAAGQAGWLSWQMNDFEGTASAFAPRARGDVHSWLWLQLANVRLGRPLSDDRDGGSAQFWPEHLVLFYRGALTDADLLAAANDAEAGRLPGKIKYAHAQCNAYLYAGLWRAVHNDQARATPLLKIAVEKCTGMIAKDLAQAELARIAPGEKAK